jgi:hypothetical protein
MQIIPLICWNNKYWTRFVIRQVLVLGNKRDLPNAIDEKELIEKL